MRTNQTRIEERKSKVLWTKFAAKGMVAITERQRRDGQKGHWREMGCDTGNETNLRCSKESWWRAVVGVGGWWRTAENNKLKREWWRVKTRSPGKWVLCNVLNAWVGSYFTHSQSILKVKYFFCHITILFADWIQNWRQRPIAVTEQKCGDFKNIF